MPTPTTPPPSRMAGAKKFGATGQEVGRLTDPRRATKIDRIDAALRALGKRLYLDAA